MANNNSPQTKAKPIKSLEKVPQELRDEIFKSMQLGESVQGCLDALTEAGFKGFEKRDVEFFARWGEASFKFAK